jgi:hypothetical protein
MRNLLSLVFAAAPASAIESQPPVLNLLIFMKNGAAIAM